MVVVIDRKNEPKVNSLIAKLFFWVDLEHYKLSFTLFMLGSGQLGLWWVPGGVVGVNIY